MRTIVCDADTAICTMCQPVLPTFVEVSTSSRHELLAEINLFEFENHWLVNFAEAPPSAVCIHSTRSIVRYLLFGELQTRAVAYTGTRKYAVLQYCVAKGEGAK